MREHIVVLYNQLITMIRVDGPSWQLIWKERYDWIKEVVVRICCGDEVKHIRHEQPQCYKWCSAYALVNDGEGGFLLVIHPKNVIRFKAHREDADISTVCHISYFERAYVDIKHHHKADHCKGNSLLGCIGKRIDNIGKNCTSSSRRPAPSASNTKLVISPQLASSPL